MSFEVSLTEALVGVLGAVGTLLGAWATLRRTESESRSRSAEVQSAAAMQLTQHQGLFQGQLLERVQGLERNIIEERERCEARLGEERARCDAEIRRLHCDIAKLRRGENAVTRHDDPR